MHPPSSRYWERVLTYRCLVLPLPPNETKQGPRSRRDRNVDGWDAEYAQFVQSTGLCKVPITIRQSSSTPTAAPIHHVVQLINKMASCVGLVKGQAAKMERVGSSIIELNETEWSASKKIKKQTSKINMLLDIGLKGPTRAARG